MDAFSSGHNWFAIIFCWWKVITGNTKLYMVYVVLVLSLESLKVLLVNVGFLCIINLNAEEKA